MIKARVYSSFNAASVRPSFYLVSSIASSAPRARRCNPRILHKHNRTTPFSTSRCLAVHVPRRKPTHSTSSSSALKPSPPPIKPTAITTADANPDPSTRPPPLDLPEKPASPGFAYYFALGKSYLVFYKSGLRSIWTNYQSQRALRNSLGLRTFTAPPGFIGHAPLAKGEDTGLHNMDPDAPKPFVPPRITGKVLNTAWRASARESLLEMTSRLTRPELQLLRRTTRDVRRALPFVLLLLICGEFTPFVVMTGIVTPPGVCMLPTQREKERVKRIEVKRDVAARLGLKEGEGMLGMVTPPRDYIDAIRRLGKEELGAVLYVIGIKGRKKPRYTYVYLLAEHFRYLMLDDQLIRKAGGVKSMVREEVEIAVMERGGVEVGLGLSPEDAEKDQRWWLERWLQGPPGGVAL